MDPYPRTWAEVDLGALGRNLEALIALAAPSRICLVAKADGYGHGLTAVGRHAVRKGVESLAIATVGEGVALREAGISCQAVVLSPVLPVDVEAAVFYDLELSVEDERMIRELGRASARQGRKARFHLKVDTGLHRFGCRPDQAGDLARLGASLGLVMSGVSTHFLDSGNNHSETERQLARFNFALQKLEEEGLVPAQIHCANSSALQKMPEARKTLCRTGMHAYGLNPNYPYEPVMRLKTRVVADRLVEAGGTVGYEGRWTARRRSRILTLGAGYGDGVPRTLSGKGEAVIRGRRVPMIGLVCMDLLMVDATSCPEAQIGDVAVLLGEGITAWEMAHKAGTNAHEIVTRIAPRVTRRFVGL